MASETRRLSPAARHPCHNTARPCPQPPDGWVFLGARDTLQDPSSPSPSANSSSSPFSALSETHTASTGGKDRVQGVGSTHRMQINSMQVLVSKRHIISIFNYYTLHGKVTRLSGISGWRGKKKKKGNKAVCVLLGEIKWK